MLSASLCATLAACGYGAGAAAPSAPPAAVAPPAVAVTPQPAAACQAASAAELAAIARRVYRQAVDGRSVVATRRRLTGSRALSAAVAAGDAPAIRRALGPLVLHQVVRLEVFGAHRRLVTLGRKSSFAPIRVAIVGRGGSPVGHVLFAVTDDRAFIALTQRLTGADVIFHRGARRIMGSLPGAPGPVSARGTVRMHGARYRAAAIRAVAFPTGAVTITLLFPRVPAAACGTDAADTRLRTVGLVGRRLFAAEQASSSVQRSLGYAAADPAFRSAAASGDPVALRAAIVGFFRNHSYHIVRVRLTKGAKVVYDLGGPYVLAPASRDVTGPDGRPAGRVTLSVQDDTGYIKLMHRFTGAAVQLRTAAGGVPGSTLAPGPATLPDHGRVSYAGAVYGVDSFTAVAFPSGPLRISLLLRSPH